MSVLEPSTLIVGRDWERAQLRDALESALAGSGALLLLGGEAGIGKTTLVEELAAEAAGLGARVLRGGCYDLTTTPPYGPWIEIVRACGALGDSVPAPPSFMGGATDSGSQAELFGQARDYLDALARERPLLLALEDLHWTDPASLELLRVVARRVGEQRLLLVATYRADELTRRDPLYQLLPLLAREAPTLRLGVRRLGAEAIRDLVDRRHPLPTADRERLCAYLAERGEGNPFYIGELLRELADEAILTTAGLGDLADVAVPPLVRQTLDGRLARLDDDTRELLEAAAVIGQDVPPDLWRAVSDADDAALDAATAQALDGRLLREAPGGQLRFAHALIREALYEGAPLMRRRAWHRRAAEALADDPRAAPDIVAHHFQQAVDPRAASWLLRAGERAQALWDLPGAVARLTAALDVPGGLAPAERVRAVHARARAHDTLGDFVSARADFEAARELAGAVGDQRAEWQALLDLGMLWASRDYAHASECYAQALTLAGALEDPATLARTLNYIGNWEMNHDEPAAAWRHHAEALATFRALDDRRGIAETCDFLGITAMLRGDTAAAAAFWVEALDLFTALEDRRAASSALAGYSLRSGAPVDGRYAPVAPLSVGLADAEESLRIAREIGWGAGELFALLTVSWSYRALGDYGASLDAADRAETLALEIGHYYFRALALETRAYILREIGRPDEARVVLESARDVNRRVGSRNFEHGIAAYLALIHTEAGDSALAERLLDETFGTDTALDSTWPCLAELARVEAARLRGDAREALARVERVIAAIPGARPERAPSWLALRRAEALAALGRVDEAEAAMRAAARDARTNGARPWLWRIQAALGRLYVEQGRHAAARAELAAARGIVAELAATLPDGELRAGYLEHALASFPTDAVAVRPGGLTARELDVLRLLADGASDREIADALFISYRTAGTHVANILNKLGVNSRTAAATLAVRQRLI